jgi:glycosyltransferase involved in cell wall biosynthesis
MKLAFVTELFFPSIGGQEVRFQELGEELVARGIQVTVYTIHFEASSPKTELMQGINVIRLCSSPNYKSKKFRRNPLDIIRFTRQLWRRRHDLSEFDAVIFNIWPILPQLILGPFLRKKTIIDICETRSGIFWSLIYRIFTWIPDVRFLGVNPEIVRYMQREYHVASDRCASIVSGVDLRVAGNPPYAKHPGQILFFGRMTKHKNPRLLVEAFHASGIAEHGFRLEVAGGGSELEELRSNFSLPGVTYHGRVSEEAKWKLLQCSSLLVMPSRREGFPRVVAEGACVGTPTLTLDFPDNGTCSVVRDFSIGRICGASKEDLIRELQAFANGKVSYTEISQHCLTVAREQFSWDTISRSLITFIEEKVR